MKFAFATLLTLAASASASEKIELTCVDEHATGYATFQSHNQKVLATRDGIFMTHIRTRNEAYTAQQWRLSRSTDGGKTFATVLEATNATNPAVIEADENENLYLIRPDFVDGSSYLYAFTAGGDYSKPRVTPIPGSAAGKFALVYDSKRKQLYYCSQNHTFHIIGLDGAVKRSFPLLVPGNHAVMQYPLMQMDGDVLHVAWTTSLPDKYLYWDIHSMNSPDGGATWRKMDGTALTLPVIADDSGPSDRITLDDEFDVHTWLSSFCVRDGKAHFFYLAQTTPWRQHYMRYDLKSAKRDIDLAPIFKGETIELKGLDGFFAKDKSAIYCIGHTPDERIGCLVSHDNGASWHDHAASEKIEKMYALGGCRDVNTDGAIIGSVTSSLSSNLDPGGGSKVFFFKIPAARP